MFRTSAAPGIYNININSQDVIGSANGHMHDRSHGIPGLHPRLAHAIATQTITAGQSASYNFSVLPVGSSFTQRRDSVLFRRSGGLAVQFHT